MVATQQRSTEESGRPSSASHAAQPNTENSATVNASVPRLEETLSLTSPGFTDSEDNESDHELAALPNNEEWDNEQSTS